jgi:hypothetical protein
MDFSFSLLRRARPLVAEYLANHLGAFCRAAWPVLHPGARLSWCWYHDVIAEYLTVTQRREILRLILNVIPRLGKSSIADIARSTTGHAARQVA